ncbi:MAG: Gfo/Idh/MocA family oxidoreductase [Verrucomicrobiota bacterium]
MVKSSSRRSFLKTSAGAGIAAPWIGWKSTAQGKPSDTVRFVCFGSNGRAWGNITSMAGVTNSKLVAVADVDTSRTGKVSEEFPDAKLYQDWRELLDKEKDNFDVAIVSTPDHMHAPIAMSAMQLGKHTYCEKPLTRTLGECRALATYAKENNIATQMGIQVGSSQGNKTAVKWLREGIVGKVQSIHSVMGKSWGSMSPLPDRVDTPPETLDWEQWCGVSKKVPFIAREYHPSQWRKRVGYGTGTLGDMGCHIYHTWFQGLNQPTPLEVTSHGPTMVDGDSWPLNEKVHYRFQGNDLTDGDFDFTWYDGNQYVSDEIVEMFGGWRETDNGKRVSDVTTSGSIVIGTEGAMMIYHGNALPVVYKDGYKVDHEHTPADAGSHHQDYADYIRGTNPEKPVANWDYAGPMSEAVLLGTVAVRIPGETLKWDEANLKFTNSELANSMVHEPYRKGWEVKGL